MATPGKKENSITQLPRYRSNPITAKHMIVVVTLNKQQVIVHKCKKKSRIVVLKTPRRDQAFNIDDPKKAKLLAYTSLCRPMLENAK